MSSSEQTGSGTVTEEVNYAAGAEAAAAVGTGFQRQLLRRLWWNPELVQDTVRAGITRYHFTAPNDAKIFDAVLAAQPGTVPENPSPGWAADLRQQALALLDEEKVVPRSAVADVLGDGTARNVSTCIEAARLQHETSRLIQEYDDGVADRAETGPASLEARAAAADAAVSTQQPAPSSLRITPSGPDQPVLVVVAGDDGSGAQAVCGMATRHLSGGAGVVTLGGAYPPGDPAHNAVRTSKARSAEEKHLVAAEYALTSQVSTVLLTDARDPEALVKDMVDFQENGFHVHFAGVVAQEDVREVNALEARIEARIEGHTSQEPSSSPAGTLATSARLAAELGVTVDLFRGDSTILDTSRMRSGEQTPAEAVRAEYKRELGYEEALRVVARASRLATKEATQPADRRALQRIVENVGARKWDVDWVFESARRAREQPAAKRWGEVSGASELVGHSDGTLEAMMVNGMRHRHKARQDAFRFLKLRGEHEQRGDTRKAAQYDDLASLAIGDANRTSNFVATLVTEQRRRATLPERERAKELTRARREGLLPTPPKQTTAAGYGKAAQPAQTTQPVRARSARAR
ncbi:hypothetical protein [Streptomyces sp. NPDC007083]|uniref:hypothetical protein n=1 Tax=unclassified Streptomyces TaxID=2593676 RepID=UPI0033C9F039